MRSCFFIEEVLKRGFQPVWTTLFSVALFLCATVGWGRDLGLLNLSMVHRGDGVLVPGRVNRPDNSLEACLLAWADNVVPEADIRTTKDGVIIAYHNASLNGKKMEEYDWSELRDVSIGAAHGEIWNHVRIPTWEGLFAAMKGRPNWKIYMDYKNVPVEQSSVLVKKFGLERQVYCHGCSYGLMKQWRQAVPNGLTSYWMWMGQWKQIEFTPERRAKGEAFMKNLFDIAAADNFANADVVHFLIQADPAQEDPFCPSSAFLKDAVERIHKAGKIAAGFPWTHGDNPELYRKLWNMGFDCFGTDYPEVMHRVIAEIKTGEKKRQVPVSRPVPRAALKERIDQGIEIYGIVHWGLNTFTDREWGYGDEDPKLLNPKEFDADQIVGACADGGLQGLVVVAKHHDGFCLWPTKTTGHNISKSPFRDGKGDYVKEMEQACRKRGLKFGVYVSPWDRNNEHYGSDKYVTDVFQAQIRELLGGEYGEIFEMWFDGANGGDGYYGGARTKRRIPLPYYRYETETFAMVRGLQPKVCIFNESDQADYRWPGNERGMLKDDCRATTASHDPANYANYRRYADIGKPDGVVFHPPEADFPLRRGWFFHEKDKNTVRCGEFLMQRYLNVVGNAGTMNIGIAPDRRGLLADEDVAALRRFNEIRKEFFAKEAAPGEEFNVVVMAEDVSGGELVDGWEFLADGKAVLTGTAIGSKRIRVLGTPVKASKCDLIITKSAGTPGKVAFKRYLVNQRTLNRVMNATTTNGETDTAVWMEQKR